MGFHHVGQAGLELTSGDPPALASQPRYFFCFYFVSSKNQPRIFVCINSAAAYKISLCTALSSLLPELRPSPVSQPIAAASKGRVEGVTRVAATEDPGTLTILSSHFSASRTV